MSNGKDEEKLKIELAIDELRHSLNRLEDQSDTLEAKASALFGFTAVLIAVIIFTLNSILSNTSNLTYGVTISIPEVFFILIVLDILVIMIGLVYLLQVINLRNYIYPFSFDRNKMQRIIEKPLLEFKNEIIDDYRQSIPNHHCINTKKAYSLNKSMKWLKFGISTSFLLLIIIMYLKIFGGF